MLLYYVTFLLVLFCVYYNKAKHEEQALFVIDKEFQHMYGPQAYLRDKGVLFMGIGFDFLVREDIKKVEGLVQKLDNEIKVERFYAIDHSKQKEMYKEIRIEGFGDSS